MSTLQLQSSHFTVCKTNLAQQFYLNCLPSYLSGVRAFMIHRKEDTLTPVRIRGKRRGTPAEKWHYGKRRKPELQKRLTPLEDTTSATDQATSPMLPRKRMRTDIRDTPLERLPAEVLQLIFEYSANIELPLTSRALASKLSKSQHLQHQLATEVLQPVLGNNTATAAKTDLCRATRLLNSRFVTWRFFTLWLRSHVEAPPQPDGDAGDGPDELANAIRSWASLGPSPSLLPPKKLLDPVNGFTQETCNLLAVLAYGVQYLPQQDPAYGEVAYEGLLKAIKETREDAVALLLELGVVPSTETLRVAVTEGGCKEAIVLMLLHQPGRNEQAFISSSHFETHGDGDAGAVDLLDPEIWAWAEEAQKQGSERGEWLVAELRNAQQRKGSPET